MEAQKMTVHEAVQILHLPKDYTEQDVHTNFDRYFTANDPVHGGSIYLQFKFVGAKEALLEQLHAPK